MIFDASTQLAFGPIPVNAPEIIREAAKSPLGILALIVLLVAILAIRFFPTKKSSEMVRAGIFVLIFGGVLLFGFAISKSLNTPDIYRVKVIVLNLQGVPTDDAKVWSSFGGEAKKIAGGWEYDIAGAVLPTDRNLDIYASQDSQFTNGHSRLSITDDHNPIITVALEQKETTVRGRVLDETGTALADVSVSVDGYPNESRQTDIEGNFVLDAHAPEHQPVNLHAHKKGYSAANQEHFAGKDPATIVLLRR